MLSFRRVMVVTFLALMPVLALACDDQVPDLSTLQTVQPQDTVASQAATPTALVRQAVSATDAGPDPTATPVQRRFAGAARSTPTPAPAGGDQFVDAPDNSGLVQADSAFTSAQTRTSTGGRFAISIDGSGPDLLDSMEGGYIWAQVAESPTQGRGGTNKHLSSITYRPFDIEVGMGMSVDFYDWIEDAIGGNPQQVNGEVIAVGADFGALSTRQFLDAFISEITFPALDASSNESAHLSVQFISRGIFYDDADNDLAEVSPANGSSKRWLTSNFRVEIGSLPTDRVAKIDSFTWKQHFAEDQVGAFGNQVIQPTSNEVSNLRLTISMADIDRWADWFDDFVVSGQASDADELSGTITFLAPDLQSELATIQLDHIGIVALSLPDLEAGGDQPPRFIAVMYVEDVFFEYIGDSGSSKVSAPPPTSVPPAPIPAAQVQPATPIATATVTARVTAVSLPPTATPQPAASANEPPTVVFTSRVEDVEGSPIVLDYRLSDPTGDTASVEVEYSIDGGRRFAPATRTSRADITTRLATSAAGVTHRFTWNAAQDLGTKQLDGVLVRITPSDASVGRGAQVGPFTYHPLRNTVASACDIKDGQWLLDSKNWNTLHKALLVCQNEVVSSIQDGLAGIDKTARSTRTLSSTLSDISSAQKLM